MRPVSPLPRWIAVLLLFCAAAAARAQNSPAEPSWSVKLGGGVSYHFHNRNSDERQIDLWPEFSRPLGRHWEYLGEADLTYFTSPAGYFLGVLPVGARYSPLSTRVRPFVSVNMGLGWTNVTDIPEITRRFNFLLEGDLGARWRARDGATWHVSGRFSHISNGGTTSSNLGLNSILLVLGRSL